MKSELSIIIINLFGLIRYQSFDVAVFQEHHKANNANVTGINILVGSDLFLSDAHTPGVEGVGFAVAVCCSNRPVLLEYFASFLKTGFDIFHF